MNLYKQPRKIKEFRKTIAHGKNSMWHCDLTDYSKIKGTQSGYILNCVDVLTRRLSLPY